MPEIVESVRTKSKLDDIDDISFAREEDKGIEKREGEHFVFDASKRRGESRNLKKCSLKFGKSDLSGPLITESNPKVMYGEMEVMFLS